MKASSTGLVNLFDYEARAREVLPGPVWNMVYHGSADEASTKRLRPVFESIFFRPKALRDVSQPPNTSTVVLGTPIDIPVMPSAPGSKLYADADGDMQTTRAVAAAGTIVMIPHITTYQHPIEDHVEAAPNTPRWFQLYVLKDRGATRTAIERAEAAGCSAIILTVSAPGGREHASRVPVERGNGTADIRLGIFRDVHFPGVVTGAPEFSLDPELDWSALDWIRSITDLPIVVKGVVSREDARIAVDNGAAGVLVSMHASRLFDGPITPIEALPAVVDEVGDECEVFLDGGIRTGSDVLKALALGARLCLIGKPLYYGLAVGGEDGVRDIFRILKTELQRAMAICGVASIAEIDSSLVSGPVLEPV
jgi:4-hydroxymandelate oxidase